ncbi:threonylcarbamoyladenosine tRNA methylthiotransferase isoform X4 [Cherax quadricarinatus]|uniref:threonylcarbamoyladenosine tRNA methylthiotransferase isoform X4 n=1 Tax=Cherax quadricarinatus TaxID=27406 RepID=UPI002378BF4F|nr:threonylcarbamoyladenosine tRNA methylthiotransferase-like isoform X4 [Cherax quadricarinatus]
MEDIEDLVREGADLIAPRSRNSVMPRVRRRKVLPSEEAIEEPECESQCTSIIPGTQKVYLKTWGCAHNSSDSEYMAGQLAAYGYKIVDEKFDADVWVLNSCTVKNPAEDHFRNEIKAGREAGKKVVVAGCVSQAAPRSEFLEGLSIIGVQQIDRVVEVVEETLKEEIVARAKQSFSEGVCEVWLTSEDTGAYGRDIGVSLPELLWQLVEVIPEGCRLRLGMTNPPYILDHLEEMSKIMQHPRVYAFLHVPVQSGSDGVLGEMKREYTVNEFCRVVDFLKSRVPGITIATDIICGFPTETEEDFQETVKLCSKYKFPSLFINQFYPRPGTPAAKMQRIPTKEVKNRTRRLTEVFQSYRPYDHKLGEKQTVLVTEEAHDKEHWVGHNKYYEQVLVPKNEDFLGKLVEVEIIETGKHYMRGRPIETSKPISPAMTEYLPKGEISGFLSTQDISDSNKRNQMKEDLAKQERYIILSFILLISALLVKLAWVCFKMLNGNMID